MTWYRVTYLGPAARVPGAPTLYVHIEGAVTRYRPDWGYTPVEDSEVIVQCDLLCTGVRAHRSYFMGY